MRRRLRSTAAWPTSPSPIALEVLERIGRLYKIEEEIRGRPPDERQAVRQARAGPELKSLHEWLQKTVTALSKKCELTQAIRYARIGRGEPFGPAHGVLPASGSVVGSAGPAPPGAGAGTGSFQATPARNAWTCGSSPVNGTPPPGGIRSPDLRIVSMRMVPAE